MPKFEPDKQIKPQVAAKEEGTTLSELAPLKPSTDFGRQSNVRLSFGASQEPEATRPDLQNPNKPAEARLSFSHQQNTENPDQSKPAAEFSITPGAFASFADLDLPLLPQDRPDLSALPRLGVETNEEPELTGFMASPEDMPGPVTPNQTYSDDIYPITPVGGKSNDVEAEQQAQEGSFYRVRRLGIQGFYSKLGEDFAGCSNLGRTEQHCGEEADKSHVNTPVAMAKAEAIAVQKMAGRDAVSRFAEIDLEQPYSEGSSELTHFEPKNNVKKSKKTEA